jgi:hypothetical protein
MEWSAELMSETFEFTIGDKAFEWNYAHTVNTWDVRYSVDFYNPNCFSLNYGRDDYTPAEVMAYALEWMNNDV